QCAALPSARPKAVRLHRPRLNWWIHRAEEPAALADEHERDSDHGNREVAGGEWRQRAVEGLTDERADDAAAQRGHEAQHGGRRSRHVAERLHGDGVEVRSYPAELEHGEREQDEEDREGNGAG